MVESKSALLRRFVCVGDTEAFADIVRRYAGLVYSTCLRVLADTDQAADATRETFYQFVKRAGEIQGSLAAWLHQVAVHKAVDVIRTDSARRQREKRYAEAKCEEDRTWQELSAQVDEALTQLDGPTRELLIRRYLEGCSLADLAREMGVSRATVTRQVDSGVARLRAQLQRRGVLATPAALSTLLTENVAQSAPAAVLGQLGKIVLAGSGIVSGTASTGSVPALLSGGLAATAKLKAVVAVATIVAGAGLVTYTGLSFRGSDAVSTLPAAKHESAGPTSNRRILPPLPSTGRGTAAEVREQGTEQKVAAVAATPVTAVAASVEVPDKQQHTVTQDTPTSKSEGFRLDLSSPEATVRSFTKAMVSGDAESVLACFLPGGTDYEDIQKILHAKPDDPAQQDQYRMRLWLQSFDPDTQMPVISVQETEHGTEVAWQVTFKKDVTMAGQTFRTGETFNLDATLRKSGDSWLIDGI